MILELKNLRSLIRSLHKNTIAFKTKGKENTGTRNRNALDRFTAPEMSHSDIHKVKFAGNIKGLFNLSTGKTLEEWRGHGLESNIKGHFRCKYFHW